MIPLRVRLRRRRLWVSGALSSVWHLALVGAALRGAGPIAPAHPPPARQSELLTALPVEVLGGAESASLHGPHGGLASDATDSRSAGASAAGPSLMSRAAAPAAGREPAGDPRAPGDEGEAAPAAQAHRPAGSPELPTRAEAALAAPSDGRPARVEVAPDDGGAQAPRLVGSRGATPSGLAASDAPPGGGQADGEQLDGGTGRDRQAKDAGAAHHPAEAGRAGALALLGGSSSAVDPAARLQLVLELGRLRDHAFAARFARELRARPLWRAVLGVTALDPLRDLDTVVLVGPRFDDIAQLAVVARHRLGVLAARQVVQGLLERAGGRWLERGRAARLGPLGGAPAGPSTGAEPAEGERATARAARVAVLVSPTVALLAPPSAGRDAVAKHGRLEVPHLPAGEVLEAHVKEPAKVFADLPLPFDLPGTLRWLHVGIDARADGGYLVRFVLADTDARAARADREVLTRGLALVLRSNFGKLGSGTSAAETRPLAERVRVGGVGATIEGEIEVRPAQVARLLDLAHTAPAESGGGELSRAALTALLTGDAAAPPSESALVERAVAPGPPRRGRAAAWGQP